MNRVGVEPGLLRWARERSGRETDYLRRRFPKLDAWERGSALPTFRQLEDFAKATYTPVGYFFLQEPPDDSLPVADLRTIGDEPLRRPSPNLLDTVYAMQRRQAWMRDELIIEYETPPLSFVGQFTFTDNPLDVADAIREALGLEPGWASRNPNWESAQRFLRDKIEEIGVMLVINGVVGNNTHRKLDAEEFRGFALVDEYAPLIFINNADYKTAQMFTIAHELAHIFVGETGVSSFENFQPSAHNTEQFCNRTAAEFLVPARELLYYWNSVPQTTSPYAAIARQFKVSSVVAARRALDLDLIGLDEFFTFYNEHNAKERVARQQAQSGGDFWNTQRWRIGSRFAAAVIGAVKEGRLTYKEAYSLTDLRGDTFENLPDRMGIAV